jgi:purine-nucleoside phosphorylase
MCQSIRYPQNVMKKKATSMNNPKCNAIEAAEYLKVRIAKLPEIGLLTGTGLAESVENLNMLQAFNYQDIPHFPTPTVESHFGRLLFGRLQNKVIVAMQGRFHLYEGLTPLEITFPLRVMQELGVQTLVVTNAAGGINPGFRIGDLMIITDHINLTGSNPLLGPNEESWGPRFPDMIGAYDKKLVALAEKTAKSSEIDLQKGVYVGLKGPSLETPAEIRFLRTIGADAVGFSTVQEVIVAVHAGMRVLGVSIITNIHNPDAPVPASVSQIIAAARSAAPRLNTLFRNLVESI